MIRGAGILAATELGISSCIMARGEETLFPQEFRRCNAGLLLEEAGEVVRILKTQKVCCFVDIMTVHQEVLALLYQKGMDIADGRSAGGLVDDVAQVTG